MTKPETINGSKLFAAASLLVQFLFTGCVPSGVHLLERMNGSLRTIEFAESTQCKKIDNWYAPQIECHTPHFPVESGHYDLSLRFRARNLEQNLPDAIGIRIAFYDSNGADIPVEIPYLDRVILNSSLDSSLLNPVEGSDLLPDAVYEIALKHRPYPADTNWFPHNAQKAAIVVQYNGNGSLQLGSLSIKRTDWNVPLWNRNSCLESRSGSGKRPPHIAVMSQGPIELQYKKLQSALASQIADTYLLELGPDSFKNDQIESRTKELIALLNNSGARWGIAYHPYWESEPQRKESSFQISSKASLATINKRISWLVTKGAKIVILRADDLVPTVGAKPFGYALTKNADLRRFGTLAKAHLYLIDQVFSPLPSSVSKYFVPPWYSSFFVRNNPTLANEYFTAISNMPKDIGLFWTGPSVRSLSIDQIELDAFRRLTGGRALSLWDNTLYARRHKDFWSERPARFNLLSFFEPYSVSFPKTYLSADSPGEDLLLLNGELNAFNQIQMQTTSSFFINDEPLCSPTTIADALTKRWGEDTANELIELDQNYWSFCHNNPSSEFDCASILDRLKTLAEEGLSSAAVPAK